MPPDPDNEIVPGDAPPRALMRLGGGRGGASPGRLFCASPTVLEAINHVLYHRGLPTLWLEADGTIGPSDPLMFRVEYGPSPFVS